MVMSAYVTISPRRLPGDATVGRDHSVCTRTYVALLCGRQLPIAGNLNARRSTLPTPTPHLPLSSYRQEDVLLHHTPDDLPHDNKAYPTRHRRPLYISPSAVIMDHRPQAWGRVSRDLLLPPPPPLVTKTQASNTPPPPPRRSPETMSTAPTMGPTCSPTAVPSSTPSSPW